MQKITKQLEEKANFFLKETDPLLGEIIRSSDPLVWEFDGDYFFDLVDAIISQQLSGKAASTIFTRFKNILNNDISPHAILKTPDEELRKAGVSWQKISYIKSLAQHAKDQLLAFSEFDHMSDAEIIVELTKVKGIGRWTAEMFLMFTMGRPDVFSYGDLGLRKGMQKIYKLEKEPTSTQAEEISLKWRPYRTIASRYLWKSLEI